MTSIGFVDRWTGGKANPLFQSVTEICPDLTGKNIVVTGANSGVGAVSALEFARKGARVFMLCRSQERALPVLEDIKKTTGNEQVEFIKCDLSDWKSVVDAADQIKSRDIPIHILLNNAGVMALPDYQECKQGIELQLSGNHFGHFILTRELLPLIKRAGDGARVVCLSSMAHKQAKIKNSGLLFKKLGFDFDQVLKKDSYAPYWNYGQTKLANLLFSNHLSKLFTDQNMNVYVNAVHPGVVETNLFKSASMGQFAAPFTGMLCSSAQTGAMTQIYACAHPEVVEKNYKGKYFIPVGQVGTPTYAGSDPELAKKLWDWTNDILKEKGFYKDWEF